MHELRELPRPILHGQMSLEEALSRRRSVREFRPDPLPIEMIGQLLWATLGTTDPSGRRTAPSAGNLQSLEVYVMTQDGNFRYHSAEHALETCASADLHDRLSAAALDQECVLKAPAVFVITAEYDRLARKYGERSQRYACLEAGHAVQNLLLQATALGLAAVPAGAFNDSKVRNVLQLPAEQAPIYLVPVGHPE